MKKGTAVWEKEGSNVWLIGRKFGWAHVVFLESGERPMKVVVYGAQGVCEKDAQKTLHDERTYVFEINREDTEEFVRRKFGFPKAEKRLFRQKIINFEQFSLQ